MGLVSYTLSLVFNGTGGGLSTSTAPPFSCNTGCTRKFFDITPLTLTAGAAQYSLFGGWDGCVTVNGADCSLNLDQDRTATVTFTKDTAHTVRIDGPPPTYYLSLQDAYDHAATGNTIQAWGIDLATTLVCGVSKQVTILGGYDQQYQNHFGVTTMRGLTIARGTVTVDRIVIK